MSINSLTPCKTNVSFQANKNTEKKVKKHPIKAVMSAIVPGTGQLLSGRIITGAGYLAAATAIDTLTAWLTFMSVIAHNSGSKNIKLFAGTALSALASICTHISSAKNAYGGKKD